MQPVDSTSAPGTASGNLPDINWQTTTTGLLRAALFDWAVIITAWMVMTATESVVVTVFAMLVIAGRIHALGAILHDACHAKIQRKSPQWYLVEALAGWPVSSTIEAMRYHHLRHHRYVGTVKDPYRPAPLPLFKGGLQPMPLLYARGLLLPGWWTLRPLAGMLALVLPQVQTAYARLFLQDRSQQDLTHSTEIIRCAKADRVQLAAHLILLAAILTWQIPFLYTWLIPLHIAGVLNARRVALEHPPVTQGTLYEQPVPATEQANITASNSNGWLQKWLLSPHNMGLHSEHHRYPRVAYRYLPKLKSLTS